MGGGGGGAGVEGWGRFTQCLHMKIGHTEVFKFSIGMLRD